jgi:DNA-directed RNA polymerase III subunit RPC1
MDVKKNLITPRHGVPMIAATQDFLTASYLITNKDIFLDRAEFMKALGYFGDANERIDLPPPSIVKPIELWTGKQVYSVLLRPSSKINVTVNLSLAERNYSELGEHMCSKDGWVIVRNNELLCGNLCKNTLGNGSKKGLFYVLIRDNSAELAATCMKRLSKFTSRWISHYGMSIGISDVTPFKELVTEKKNMIKEGYQQCNTYHQMLKDGKIELQAGCDPQ